MSLSFFDNIIVRNEFRISLERGEYMLIVVTILGALATNVICGRKYAIACLITIPIFCTAMTWVENTFGYQIVMLLSTPVIAIASIGILKEEA